MYLCNHFQYKFIVFSFKFVTLFQHSNDMSRSRSWNSKTVALKARGEMCSSEEMSEFSFPLITTEDVSLKVKLFEDAILKANCMFCVLWCSGYHAGLPIERSRSQILGSSEILVRDVCSIGAPSQLSYDGYTVSENMRW